jgi:3-oxoacyl-[acyl-carrier protein] reductase
LTDPSNWYKVLLFPMKLDGLVAVVTGASRGLGRAIASKFLDEGAQVVLCGRNADSLAGAAKELVSKVGDKQRVVAVEANVAHADDVDRLFAQTEQRFGRLDVLVNNAGVLGPLGRLEDTEWGAWVEALQANLLGPVLTMRAALPIFRRQGRGKIINLSGGGATAPRPGVTSYATAKAAIVRLTETVAEETSGTGIDVNAIAPGILNTDMLAEMIAAGAERVGQAEYDKAVREREAGAARLQAPTELCVFLASKESDGISGRLISAVWDGWREFPARRKVLAGSDLYTLRRITPKDRGYDWE